MIYKKLVLLSCFLTVACSQQTSVPSSGQFTSMKFKKPASRMPASTNVANIKLKQFEKFQDTKQILVHCQLDSKHTSSCYRDIFNKKLTHFTKSVGKIDKESLALIKSAHSFEKVREEFNGLDKHLMHLVSPKVDSIVSKRAKFCSDNSKEDLHRCLNQFVKRDTFTITNKIQHENQAMNGQEYLYVKNLVEHDLKEKLFLSKVRIRRNRKL